MSVITPELLKLSQTDGTVLSRNGHFRINLAHPITINDGDRPICQEIFIDSQKPTNETIILNDDTDITISFLYYEFNHSFTDKAKQPAPVVGPTQADNEIYILYAKDGTKYQPVIGEISLTVPAGSYEPTALAQYLTNELSKTQQYINGTAIQTGNALLISSDADQVGGAVNSFADIDWGASYGSTPNFTGDQTAWGPDVNSDHSDQGEYYWQGENRDDAYGRNSQGYPIAAGGAWLSLAPGVNQIDADAHRGNFYISPESTSGNGTGLVVMISPISDDVNLHGLYGPNAAKDNQGNYALLNYTIVNGGTGYQRGDTVTFDSRQFGTAFDTGAELAYKRIGYDDMTAVGTGKLVLTIDSIIDAASDFVFIKRGQDPTNPQDAYKYTSAYWIGASEFDIEYNTNGNGYFSINYIHTPFYKAEANQPLQPAIKLSYAAGVFNTVTVDCGILLVDMSPYSFWQDVMNFDVPNITVRDSRGLIVDHTDTNTVDVTTINRARTTGYVGLNSYLVNDDQGQGQTAVRKIPLTTDTTVATTLTNSIDGDEYQIQSGVGYYEIAIEGAFVQKMVDKDLRLVSAVVSRQYSAAEIITGYEESSVAYVHRGNPITFTSLEVRIMDGGTGQVPDDLGEDNTIFLRIDRGQNSIPMSDEQIALAEQQASKQAKKA